MAANGAQLAVELGVPGQCCQVRLAQCRAQPPAQPAHLPDTPAAQRDRRQRRSAVRGRCRGGVGTTAVPTPFVVVDQFGYRPSSEKIAVIRDPQTGYDADQSFTPGAQYALVDAASGTEVLTGAPVAWNGGNEDASVLSIVGLAGGSPPSAATEHSNGYQVAYIRLLSKFVQ
jgi:hypothetical protein